jgi:hypothetical protein
MKKLILIIFYRHYLLTNRNRKLLGLMIIYSISFFFLNINDGMPTLFSRSFEQ